ncbi:hypothetical protein B0H13DRAFT_1936560 [Mycena leptocephala]|nr:hypothetical protein B0H13DRAFT_1936560 [Mycena leptocephala]
MSFTVARKSISHSASGKADITQPITPPENDRFILHDSMGFEHGASEEFNIAKDFLESRSGDKLALEERVHVIWLCIRIPFAADPKSLIIAEGDQAFLKLAAAISVFTQFDVLVTSFMLNPVATPASALAQAESTFQALCTEPLQAMSKGFRVLIKYQRMSGLAGTNPDAEALAQLIEKSQFIGDRHVEEEVWIVHAVAQRADVKAKLKTSFEIGMTQYWKYVAASAEVTVMSTIAECLDTLHQEIVTSWNIYDPNEASNLSPLFLMAEYHTASPEIAIFRANQSPHTSPSGTLTFSSADVDSIRHWIGLAVPVAAFSGPAAVAVVLSAEFAKWITRVHKKNKAFGLVHLKPAPVALDRDMLDMAVQGYRNFPGHMGEVHHEIRCYASEVGIFDKDRLRKKMGELIWRFCSQQRGSREEREEGSLLELLTTERYVGRRRICRASFDATFFVVNAPPYPSMLKPLTVHIPNAMDVDATGLRAVADVCAALDSKSQDGGLLVTALLQSRMEVVGCRARRVAVV